MKADVETTVTLQCQRCMESFNYEIINDFVLGLIHTEEEAAQLPEEYDPLIIEDGTLAIHDVIEDELMMSLPLVPMHDPKHCGVKLPFKTELGNEINESPFKVIEILRSKRNKK